jgi:Cft2 family RNA processing exonuclease
MDHAGALLLVHPGCAPPHYAPDLVATESTYDDRPHANRESQERALAETVATTVEAGGEVLVPAFAVGRSWWPSSAP